MLSYQTRMHGRGATWRHAMESTLWNAGIITLTLLTIALVFFGVLAIRAN